MTRRRGVAGTLQSLIPPPPRRSGPVSEECEVRSGEIVLLTSDSSLPTLDSRLRPREDPIQMAVATANPTIPAEVAARVKRVELDVAGRTLSLETGLIAEQAHGA